MTVIINALSFPWATIAYYYMYTNILKISRHGPDVTSPTIF
jgi:hypothetical protein